MTNLAKLWKELRFVSDYHNFTPVQAQYLQPILEEELQAREIKRIHYLM